MVENDHGVSADAFRQSEEAVGSLALESPLPLVPGDQSPVPFDARGAKGQA